MAPHPNQIIIRPARIEEVGELSDLCLRSKAHWPYDAAFIEACRDELTITEHDLVQHTVRVAENAGVPIGVIRLDQIDDGFDLEMLFVEPKCVGKGVGRQLLDWSIDHARAFGAKRITTVADPHAEPFYAHMGFKKTGVVPSDSIPGRTLPFMVLTL